RRPTRGSDVATTAARRIGRADVGARRRARAVARGARPRRGPPRRCAHHPGRARIPGRGRVVTDDAYGFETRAIHSGQEPDPTTGAVVVPLVQSSTFAQDGVGRPRNGWEYSRSANPTRAALETALVDLEEGTVGLAMASGLAATDTLI